MREVLITAIAGFTGAILGSTIPPLLQHLIHKFQRNTEWKREALLQQLNELYRPLYEHSFMKDSDPEHYFCDWEPKEFHEWLHGALEIICTKLHLAPDEIMKEIFTWREVAARSEYDAEPAVRKLYDHIGKHFQLLRRELRIS